MKRQTLNLLSGKGPRIPRRTRDLLRLASKEDGLKRTCLRAFAGAALVFCTAVAFFSGPAIALATLAVCNFAAGAMAPTQAAQCWGLRAPRIVNPVNGFQGIAASATATLNVPVDRRYHSMRILTTNTAGALTDPTTIASNVKLIVNGITIRDHAPAYYINLAKTFRITPNTGEIPIFFSEPWRNDVQTAEATSWDMAGQNTFVVQVTFLAPGGGVGIQAVLADFDGDRNARRNAAGQMEPFLAIIKSFDQGFNAALGDNDIVNIPTNWPIQRIFCDISANAFASVTIFGDQNVNVFQATKTQNQLLLNANLITGTFFEFPIIFDYDSKLGSNLKTQALDVRANVTVGVATITLHVNQLLPRFA